jgi:hypothetical protein
MKYLTHYLTRKALIVTAVIVVIVVLGVYGVYHFIHRHDAEDQAEYASYIALAKAHENAAYIPGAGDNPVRQELSKVLFEILTRKMTDAERLKLAQEGEAVIKQSTIQIDDIGTTGEPVDAAIARIESASHTAGPFSSGGAKVATFVELAKHEQSVIADIRGLSYRNNYEIQKIFDRIIADKGKLTPAYITTLNNQTPEIEKESDKRTNLYTDLQDTSAQIDQMFTTLNNTPTL